MVTLNVATWSAAGSMVSGNLFPNLLGGVTYSRSSPAWASWMKVFSVWVTFRRDSLRFTRPQPWTQLGAGPRSCSSAAVPDNMSQPLSDTFGPPAFSLPPIKLRSTALLIRRALMRAAEGGGQFVL